VALFRNWIAGAALGTLVALAFYGGLPGGLAPLGAQSPALVCYAVPAITGSPFTNCTPISDAAPLPVFLGGSGIITGNATGSTSAVVGTLAAATGKTTYICGFDVSAIGGTAAVGPVTVAGTIGSSLVYQMSSLAAGTTLSRTFTPCIPANAAATAITVTTTADGSASAVDVNSWGYQR
jgi:hypothetical protein